MEAEVDQVVARDAPAEQARLVPRRRARHEVELHAREPLLEIEEIHRLDAPHHAAAAGVDRFVRKQRHGAYARRSVRSTTRITSSMLVTPARTRRTPSSARVRKPLARAAVMISRAVARRATSSSIAASIFSSSRIDWRPR